MCVYISNFIYIYPKCGLRVIKGSKNKGLKRPALLNSSGQVRASNVIHMQLQALSRYLCGPQCGILALLWRFVVNRAMANFKHAFEATMRHEGGHSNLAADRGGETYMGISRKSHPDWRGWANLDEPNVEVMVEEFYLENYWLDLGPQDLSDKVFDISVNMGNRTAYKFVQEALNLLGCSPGLVVDGFLGERSFSALRATLRRKDEATLCKVLAGLQFLRYKAIVERDPTQKQFFYGWVRNRV